MQGPGFHRSCQAALSTRLSAGVLDGHLLCIALLPVVTDLLPVCGRSGFRTAASPAVLEQLGVSLETALSKARMVALLALGCRAGHDVSLAIGCRVVQTRVACVSGSLCLATRCLVVKTLVVNTHLTPACDNRLRPTPKHRSCPLKPGLPIGAASTAEGCMHGGRVQWTILAELEAGCR